MDATSTAILGNMFAQLQPLWSVIVGHIFVLWLGLGIFIFALGTTIWYIVSGIRKIAH